MASVVIAAHNEAAVIGRCLDSLLEGTTPGELEVVVVANGCSDATAEIAASRVGVRVIEIAEASKPAALNMGDTAVVGFPRVYLDADIPVTASGVRAVCEALRPSSHGPSESDGGSTAMLAAAPRRVLDLTGCPLLVRAYFAINSRLPVFDEALFGRGMIALSEPGRSRFVAFPDMVADDLFLDSLFSSAEKRQVDEVATVVAAPRRTRDLVRRLVRVRRGNAAMRGAGRAGEIGIEVRAARRMSWLRDVVLPRPWLAPAAAVYVAISLLAAVEARRTAGARSWGRDDSSREVTRENLTGGDRR
jgi:glycosyltransferase involved in cell wall biosynthesis